MKNKNGRPPVVDDLVLQKLEQAFSFGCTDLEACLFANISKSTLYNYQNANPDFLERKEALKENPILLARQSVIRSMEEDGNLALKYLERKRKDEFSTKTETEHSGNIGLKNILDEIDGKSAGLPEDQE